MRDWDELGVAAGEADGARLGPAIRVGSMEASWAYDIGGNAGEK